MYRDISSNNLVKFDVDSEAIKNSLRNILNTRKGEFPGDPTFGCSLNEYVFSLNDDLTKVLIENEVSYAIKVWEKRVTLEGIRINLIPEYNKIVVNVAYSIKSDTNKTPQTVNITI